MVLFVGFGAPLTGKIEEDAFTYLRALGELEARCEHVEILQESADRIKGTSHSVVKDTLETESSALVRAYQKVTSQTDGIDGIVRKRHEAAVTKARQLVPNRL